MSLRIPVINQSSNPLPEYATAGSAGLDIRAHLDAPVTLASLERALIPTGIFLAIPEGYEIQVRPRSGLAFKQGITCLNTPGTIDSDYRGEIKVLLVNLSHQTQIIEPGERIAQLVLQKTEQLQWEPAENLPPTNREAGGFGSTGKH